MFASPSGGIKELVIDHVNGLLVEPDVQSWIDAVKLTAAGGVDLAAMRTAIKGEQQAFSPDYNGSRTIAFLDKIIAKANAKRSSRLHLA